MANRVDFRGHEQREHIYFEGGQKHIYAQEH